jgi:AcrR family transcriptional regulator
VCFAAEGVDVPGEEIARRAGVGMGTLYRRFPAKEDLIDAVLADSLDAYARTAERFLAEEDPWAGFCGFLESALELHAENVALKDVLASGDHGAEGVEAARERLRPIVARLISRAQEAGALRADFTPRDV